MSEQIQVLSEKDKARKKINVWHGSSQRWIKMIHELIGNSLDIFTNDKINEIKIIIHNKNKIEYIDSATGIPIEQTASNGKPNYEAIFETSFAGSKYSASQTVGTNGVYLWTLTATCEDIEYYIARPNGNIYNISYHKGDRSKELNIIGKSESTYSRLVFSLDEEVWDKPNFTFEEISNIAQGQSSLAKVKISIEDKERELYKEFYYKNGILDYFEELTKNKNMISDNVRIAKNNIITYVDKYKSNDDMFIDLIFNFSNDSNDDIQKDYLNTADLVQHGTIQEGIFLGLKNSIHKWLKDNAKYQKNEKAITLEDVSVGLNYISNVKSCYVEFVSQVKEQCLNPHHKTVIKEIIEEYMEIFFIENPIQSELICSQVLINSRARLSADKTRQNIKKKLEEANKGGKVKIEGLTDCNMKKSTIDERFLLVVEGLSPKETVVESYDNRIFGALGLKGRFISCLKKSVEEVLNNIPAYTLIQALGCGIEIPYEERKMFKDIKTFDKNNLRYGNIGILTDADCWGSGIRLALLTFIYKYLPTLLKENRVYIIISPRYEIKMKNGEMVYVYNDREKEQFMKTVNEDDIYNIGIVKGIGEINKDDFWDKVLCPEAREKTFIRVNYDNVDDVINKCFEDYMGEDTQARKDFVAKFITKINLEEIN
jgi:DNA gyrase subunit B